ncbi:MAG: CsbD family protein [Parachlamydiales bacterium]|nr:CsbD family protein [Parachlamydiales bacterium]
MTKAIFCLANDTPQAESIIDDLKSKGISSNDISILFPDKGSKRDLVHEKETKAPEGYSVGVGSGGIIGGVLGLLAGIGALAIPGVGPFVAAGPIMAALSGSALGMAVGGLLGALVGLGIPEIVAKQYEGKINNGNILICVSSDSKDNSDNVLESMERLGGIDICITEESRVKAQAIKDACETKCSSSRIEELQDKLKEQTVMTSAKMSIKGNWNVLKGTLKQKYAQLTDDDLIFVEGKEDELVGQLQKKLGVTEDEIRQMLSSEN